MKFQRNKTSKGYGRKAIYPLGFIVCIRILLFFIPNSIKHIDKDRDHYTKDECTSEQRTAIMTQLSPEMCNKSINPYSQECSLTQATKCPESEWIDTHYEILHQQNNTNALNNPLPFWQFMLVATRDSTQ